MTSTPSTPSTDGLPTDLNSVQPLWETHLEATRNRPASVTRLYDDGRVYTWSNSRRRMAGGQLRRDPAPYAWRLDARLRPEGVDLVRELIRTEFQQLPPSGSISLGQDQGVVIRRSYLDGAAHAVTLPTSATSDLPKAVREIETTISANVIPGGVPIDQ